MRLSRFYIATGQLQKSLDVLDEAEEEAYGADLLYCRAACLYQLGHDTETIDMLSEGLMENFDEHYLFFELALKARTDKQVQAAINYYRYE